MTQRDDEVWEIRFRRVDGRVYTFTEQEPGEALRKLIDLYGGQICMGSGDRVEIEYAGPLSG